MQQLFHNMKKMQWNYIIYYQRSETWQNIWKSCLLGGDVGGLAMSV
jgi:hypothetical protein